MTQRRSSALAWMLVLASVPAHAALIGRAPATPGGTDYQVYFDTVLNITWLADANYARTSGFAVNPTGQMTYSETVSWIAHLNATQHLGVTGWRLPMMVDLDVPGCPDRTSPNGTDCGYNVDTGTAELASMYYDTLSNVAFFRPDGSFDPDWHGGTNMLVGPFSNLEASLYWYGLDYIDPDYAWYFGTFSGGQGPLQKETNQIYAWAVLDGDALVPIPAAAWLFGGALGLVAWLRRRQGSMP